MQDKDGKNTLEVVFEYHMLDDNLHSIDAFTHNQSEKYLLDGIRRMEKILGKSITLRLRPYREGSFIDVMEFALGSGFASTVFMLLFNHFFSPAPAKTKEEKMIDRLDILDRLRKEKLTDEEISYLIKGDKTLLKACNGYYSTLSKDRDIKSVNCSVCQDNNAPKIVQIERKDFATHIINNKTIQNSYVYKATTVLVTSPVLSKSSKGKWRGIFNGMSISFELKDDMFLEQVFNKEVKFEYGTTISCDVTKTTETKFGNNGEIANEKSTYMVSNITSWEDSKHLQQETKRLKKQRTDPKQLDLFSDNNSINY